MNENGYSLSDVAAVSGNGCNGMFGGSGIWIFALLILLFGMNGGLGGGGLQQSDIQRAVDLNSIQNGQRDIEARVQEIGSENMSAIKDASYNNLGEIRDLQQVVYNGFYNQQKCCCDTEKMILENRYLSEKNAANVAAQTAAQIQSVKDMISQDKVEALQGKINKLELTQALCGIPRTSPYGYGVVPFWGGACGSFAPPAPPAPIY